MFYVTQENGILVGSVTVPDDCAKSFVSINPHCFPRPPFHPTLYSITLAAAACRGTSLSRKWDRGSIENS